MLTLSSAMSDDNLTTLFSKHPERCIVLLEDVDSAGIQREKMRTDPEPETSKRSKPNEDSFHDAYQGSGETQHITLSGLLNVLDGVAAAEGRLVIMTSNDPNPLDPALVRNGRIDRKVHFGYVSTEVIGKLFEHTFIRLPEELVDAEDAHDAAEIKELASRFAAVVPARQLSPAEIQGYLLMHRTNPAAAADQAEAWASQIVRARKAGQNVISD